MHAFSPSLEFSSICRIAQYSSFHPYHPQRLHGTSTYAFDIDPLSRSLLAFYPKPMPGELRHFLDKFMPSLFLSTSFSFRHLSFPNIFDHRAWDFRFRLTGPLIVQTQASSLSIISTGVGVSNPLQLLCTSCPGLFFLQFSPRRTATPLFSCHSCFFCL